MTLHGLTAQYRSIGLAPRHLANDQLIEAASTDPLTYFNAPDGAERCRGLTSERSLVACLCITVIVEFLNNFAGRYARYTSFPIFVIDVLLPFSSPVVSIQHDDIYILLVLHGR